MLHLLSRKGNMLLHLGVLFLGLCMLVGSAPLTHAEAAESNSLAAMNLQPELPYMLTEQMELEGSDWWEIVRPDVSELAITVVCDITEPVEEMEVIEEVLVADVAPLALEEDLMVEAMSVAGEMEILEPVAEEPVVKEVPAVSGRVVAWESPVKLSSEEYNALLRIVEAESGGEDTMGRILVANVILNRVASEQFPNTVQEVVTQNHYGSRGLVYQFTPAKPGGSYWYATPSQETIKAVDRALNGEDYSEGALYFAARRIANSHHMSWFDQKLEWLFQHGNHEFYKER